MLAQLSTPNYYHAIDIGPAEYAKNYDPMAVGSAEHSELL